MLRKQPLKVGHYYHIYNRGVNYQTIFFIRENWIFFLKQLRHFCSQDKADIIAYCLMPNHYHLVVYLKSDSFGTEVMRPFIISYTRSINDQEKRVGTLFQGPFKNQHIDNERYLMHLTRYVHLNPVTAGLVSKPEDWEFSSYREYVGLRNGTLPSPDFILKVFEPVKNDGLEISKSTRAAYAEFVCGDDDPRSGLMARMLIDS